LPGNFTNNTVTTADRAMRDRPISLAERPQVTHEAVNAG
jgi:hypothetical protein